MKNIVYRPVLLLNASYEPLSTCSVKRAMKMIVKGVAKTEEALDQKIYTSTMWDEKTGEHVTVDFYCPSVIRLLDFRKLPNRMQVVTKGNIYNRDNFTCQYCGEKLTYRQLTVDHVIPVSRGGKNTWENLVACCQPCNRYKDDRLLSEIPNMKLKKIPRPVTVHTARQVLRNQGVNDPIWQKYLFYDNSVEESLQFT